MGNFAISMVGNAIIGFLMAAFVLSVLKPRFSFALTAVITLFVVFYASLYGMLLFAREHAAAYKNEHRHCVGHLLGIVPVYG